MFCQNRLNTISNSIETLQESNLLRHFQDFQIFVDSSIYVEDFSQLFKILQDLFSLRLSLNLLQIDCKTIPSSIETLEEFIFV